VLQVDGSETGETIPIRPLIVPQRKVDFLIAYDASSDSKYSWVNGTNLISEFDLFSATNVIFI
jgi:lysophospholipase